MRAFTGAEQKVFLEVEPKLRDMGLDVDSAADGQKNLEQVMAYFDKNQVAVTEANVLWLVSHRNMKAALAWVSPAAAAFNRLQLTAPEFEVVQAWLKSQRYLINAGDEAIENALACVKWVKDRNYSLNAQNLTHAITNIGSNSKIKLHWVPARPQQEQGALHNHAKHPLPTPKTDERYENGRLNHAKDPASYPEPSESSVRSRAESEARTKAEAVRGKSHGATATVQRIFITNPGTSDINWQATYEARVRAANPNPGIVLTR